MAKLIATNEGERAQAVKVRGGHTVVPSGRSVPVEPYPDLDEKLIAHFAARGVIFKPDEAEAPAGKPKASLIGRSTAKAKDTASQPSGKQPDTSADTLIGTNVLPTSIEITPGQTLPLGEVVAKAHAKSNLSLEDWNALPEADRDALLTAMVDELKAEASQQQP